VGLKKAHYKGKKKNSGKKKSFLFFKEIFIEILAPFDFFICGFA